MAVIFPAYFCQRAFRTHSPVGPHRPVGYGLLSPVSLRLCKLPLHPRHTLVPGHSCKEAVACPTCLTLESSPHFLEKPLFGDLLPPCRSLSSITSERPCKFTVSWQFCSNPPLPEVEFLLPHLCTPQQSPRGVRDPLSPPQQSQWTVRAWLPGHVGSVWEGEGPRVSRTVVLSPLTFAQSLGDQAPALEMQILWVWLGPRPRGCENSSSRPGILFVFLSSEAPCLGQTPQGGI